MHTNLQLTILSRSDETGGGAGRVACQLRDLLLRSESPPKAVNHFIAEGSNKLAINFRKRTLPRFFFKLSRFFSRLVGLPDFLSTEILTLRYLFKKNYSDIYHIHDISSAFSPYTLNYLFKIKLVVWTFHDCSPFTGGCIYPMHCNKFEKGRCGGCPQLENWPLNTRIDRTGYMQNYKIAIINKSISLVICPSHWIANQARLAGISAEIAVIPNSVDTEIFKPKNSNTIRAALGLPLEGFFVLISAMDMKDLRKGAALAVESLKKVEHSLNVVIVGKNSNLVDAPTQHRYFFFNHTTDQEKMSDFYCACDIFLFTSIADNCPLATIESLACGTPVIAFDIGGINEIVKHEHNGWLSKPADVNSLVSGISFALQHIDRLNTWSINARKSILERHNQQDFLNAHIKIYRKMTLQLEQRNGSKS